MEHAIGYGRLHKQANFFFSVRCCGVWYSTNHARLGARLRSFSLIVKFMKRFFFIFLFLNKSLWLIMYISHHTPYFSSPYMRSYYSYSHQSSRSAYTLTRICMSERIEIQNLITQKKSTTPIYMYVSKRSNMITNDIIHLPQSMQYKQMSIA